MTSVVYQSAQSEPERVAPLDPDGVGRINADFTLWLNGATITTAAWAAPTGITIGDGAATKTTGTGVATPAAPSVAAGIATALFFAETTANAFREYVLTCSIASRARQVWRSSFRS